MKTIELLQKLRAMPVFTVNDLSRILGKSDKYVKVVAYRLCKQGLVKRIERGKYTVYDDAVEIASYITIRAASQDSARTGMKCGAERTGCESRPRRPPNFRSAVVHHQRVVVVRAAINRNGEKHDAGIRMRRRPEVFCAREVHALLNKRLNLARKGGFGVGAVG